MTKGHRLIAGCDEVGRGALAGPVSVGMVVVDLSSQRELAKVRDSKLLTPAARVELVPQIREWAVAYSVGHASAAEVDAVGLICALRLAGTRAWHQLVASGVTPDAVILDGNHNWLSPQPEPAPEAELLTTAQCQQQLDFFGESPAAVAATRPEPLTEAADVVVLSCNAPVYTKVKADMQCLSVAAASVLAKVERDGMLIELDAVHPDFGWAVNKGYATASHRAAIAAHGPSPYHRLSWRLTADVEPAAQVAVGKG
ncbi:ribonuclease HII [Paeniglutamicibacter antarcticus]|uniref:Ribonuclease n=2 Tax=Arthrobacter terrae TaxID=2935737 RepID=A0A931G9W8_9MICC|nr:ribonuclease HII [Arthrobacter terrae]MBG0739122.1 ribonuclease HII [Arthrobacter terrae]